MFRNEPSTIPKANINYNLRSSKRNGTQMGGMPPIGALQGLFGAGSGTGGGVGATSGGTSAGGGMAAAGPWAALAAIIIGNEMYASKKEGHRSEHPQTHMKDLLSGEVQHQDMEKRWLPMLGIEDDSWWSDTLSLGTNLSPLNFKEQWSRMKKVFSF